jgi:hypothetical protein
VLDGLARRLEDTGFALHAGDAARDGAAAWLGRLDRMLAGHGGLVAIEEIQLFTPELASYLPGRCSA